MGLKAEIDLDDWGFPDTTPILKIPIDYDGVGKLFGETVEALAKEECPVDTGFLQSSICGSGGDTWGEAVVSAEYAQYVEYGTWKMSAQPYFTPAVEQGAQTAFIMAMEIYQQKMMEEFLELEETDGLMSSMKLMTAFGGEAWTPRTAAEGPVGGGVWGGFTQTVHGITFNRDGSVASGAKGYYQTNPQMWRVGTTMYEVAQYNREHLNEFRAEAMSRFEHDDNVRQQITASSFGFSMLSSQGSSSVNLGTAVGMYAMGSIMSSGGSWFSGLLGGMVLGGLSTLLSLVLADIFGGDEPEFTVPEIKII